MKSTKLVFSVICFSIFISQNSFGNYFEQARKKIEASGRKIDKDTRKALSSDKEFAKAFNFNKDKIVNDWHKIYHNAVPDHNLRNAINFAAQLAYPDVAAAEYTLSYISKFYQKGEVEKNKCSSYPDKQNIINSAINEISTANALVNKKTMIEIGKSENIFWSCLCNTPNKQKGWACHDQMKTKLDQIKMAAR